MGYRSRLAALALGSALAWASTSTLAGAEPFSLKQALAYPFVEQLTADRHGDRIAWVRVVMGVRNIWVADAPGLTPRQVTQFKADDGQELTGLTFSPDGKTLVFVRGGDHDANWPAKGDLAPDPASSPEEPKITLWLADPTGARPAAPITEGDDPALTDSGLLAYVKTGQVWTTKLDGPKPDGKDAKRLFFDRGKDSELAWSPDGTRLAFTSNRDDHAFIGVYAGADQPLAWMAPSSGRDGAPVWSPDGARIAFTRQPGLGGAPEPRLVEVPHPWSIWTAEAATGLGRKVWSSPTTLRGSYPEVAGEANLHWAGNDRLVFLSTQDNWPHLYTADDHAGAEARLLTPGAFMVEHMAMAPALGAVIYSANTGPDAADDDRRHLFAVKVAGGAPFALTSGETLEWSPAVLNTAIAFIGADARNPPAVQLVLHGSGVRKILDNQAPPVEFAGAQFLVPKKVTFTAPDGLVIHGQLFQTAGSSKTPGLIFVHGGPPRQMMLGWSYMDYYSHAYAMNQYYAAHGYTVLSVNYRLGIGYGHDFQHPDKGGPAGSSEYQDVLSGGKYLQGLPGVDPSRIGIWGGSYGGLLTGLALARNSDLFKAGVDFHGVHDWSRVLAEEAGPPLDRFEQGDRAAATETAFRSSPAADVATWTSPVLFIHGDDDRNVRFNETIDLENRLTAKGVAFEELVIPNEIHGFLRWASWFKADGAAADFLARKLQAAK